MSIRRRKKTQAFTQINNSALLNPTLSLKAKGLLSVMMTRPEDWEFYMDWLQKQSRDGREAHQNAMKDLESHRYVVRVRVQREDGTFGGWEYLVDDEPITEEAAAESSTAASKSIAPTNGKPVNQEQRRRTDKRVSRQSEKPSDGKPTATNTDSTKTDLDQEKTSPADAAGGAIEEEDASHAQQQEPVGAHVAPQPAPAPDGLAAHAANDTDGPSQASDQLLTSMIEQSTDTEKVPRAAEPAGHQAMMTAIRMALYPSLERCADNIEKRIAQASRELRSAGLTHEAPAGILSHIRAHHSWRKSITPQTLVEHSAEWASAQNGNTLTLSPPPEQPNRPVGRPQSTAEATQRSVDTANSVLAHIQIRRRQA